MQGIDGEKFIRDIPRLIREGEVLLGKTKDRIYIADNKNTAVIRLDYDGIEATWLVTAFIKE